MTLVVPCSRRCLGWPVRPRRDGAATGSLLNDNATGRGALEVASASHAVLDNKNIEAIPHVQESGGCFCKLHKTWKLRTSLADIPMAGARLGRLGRTTLWWYDSRRFSRRLQAEYRLHCACLPWSGEATK
jgi:hypothetical protein